MEMTRARRLLVPRECEHWVAVFFYEISNSLHYSFPFFSLILFSSSALLLSFNFFFIFFFFFLFLLRYPGPASYEKGAVESQPQNSPIPGPGYSSGALLQVSSTEKTKDPMPPSARPNDYQTLISNNQNLKIRMARNFHDEDQDAKNNFLKKTAPENKKLVDELMSMGVKPSDVQFLDTGALSGAAVGGGLAAASAGGLRGHDTATSAIDTIQERTEAEYQEASSASSKTEKALAAEYDAAHDPYLGLRPEDSEKPVSMLEKSEKNMAKGMFPSSIPTSSVASGVAGGAAAMGMGINCPDGMPFCRKALRRIGKRSLARRERREAKNAEMSETLASVDLVIQELRKDTMYYGAMEFQQFQMQIQKIVSEYLHDYSDEEICSDIGMCTVGNNQGQLPISQSAFSAIRL
jgi:hypothetical protein